MELYILFLIIIGVTLLCNTLLETFYKLKIKKLKLEIIKEDRKIKEIIKNLKE